MQTRAEIQNVNLTELSADSFFDVLYAHDGISLLWKKMLSMLKRLYAPGEDVLKLLCLYFSLIDDGNICIALDAGRLFADWEAKWRGLQQASSSPISAQAFKAVIESGVRADFSALSPFAVVEVHGIKWLFAQKYLAAKTCIESRAKALLTRPRLELSIADIAACRDTFAQKTGTVLEDEQTQAILRGMSENLIITGGPGTGKTTVVCYLLWSLFSDAAYTHHALYLAAPSGKAAERMKESISASLRRFSEAERSAHPFAYSVLNNAEPSTIHRLLRFSPASGGFMYTASHQFPKESVFVIDEASMIDTELFSALLQAIPDGARLFILGDKNQLPSVQAGAVLDALLAQSSVGIVALQKSRRFTDASAVGQFAKALQKEAPLETLPWKSAASFALQEKAAQAFPVFYYTAQTKDDIQHVVQAWTKQFYAPLKDEATNLSKAQSDEAIGALDALWAQANKARILCAERNGERGVDTINACISRLCSGGSEHFAGELLMVTQNQKLYNLYNGDCGIVVQFAGDELLYLMLEKSSAATGEAASGSIFGLSHYQFYPLHLISEDAVETAYAITIHKSQGSGYKNIAVFLPKTGPHPLLNRQLLYTAITRTEGNTYLIASQATIEEAHKTVIRRNTLIDLTEES